MSAQIFTESDIGGFLFVDMLETKMLSASVLELRGRHSVDMGDMPAEIQAEPFLLRCPFFLRRRPLLQQVSGGGYYSHFFI